MYSGWNVLVEVKSGSTVLAAYGVNGLGQRVTENEGGTLTDVYFSSAWQVVEEDVSGSMTNQYVLSPVYVNAMIERDTPTQRLYVQQDANWNITALVNTSGTVVERYVFDPYGGVTYLTASWGSQSGSNYDWHYLFQGGRFDTAAAFYDFQRRDYSPTLGRWLEDDPAGFDASDSDFYRTEGDAPAQATDPTGLQGVIKPGAGLPPPPPPGAILVAPPVAHLDFSANFGVGWIIGLPIGIRVGATQDMGPRPGGTHFHFGVGLMGPVNASLTVGPGPTTTGWNITGSGGFIIGGSGSYNFRNNTVGWAAGIVTPGLSGTINYVW